MKGRRILRPNCVHQSALVSFSTRFNEGPENSPAKPVGPHLACAAFAVLQ